LWALALLANFKLCQKVLPGKNALVYLSAASVMNKKELCSIEAKTRFYRFSILKMKVSLR
jgi:hypothetical protein